MIKIQHNVESAEIKEIPLTEDEIADVLARQEAAKPKLKAIKEAEAQAQAKREAALEKLSALGLTADDLKALGL